MLETKPFDYGNTSTESPEPTFCKLITTDIIPTSNRGYFNRAIALLRFFGVGAAVGGACGGVSGAVIGDSILEIIRRNVN